MILLSRTLDRLPDVSFIRVVLVFLLYIVVLIFAITDKTDKLHTSILKIDDSEELEAIALLHHQLDHDEDGSIEPSETGDFIRKDLDDSFSETRRQRLFHKNDSEVTVSDLWRAWTHSAVYNWSQDQTLDWLIYYVDLPQYRDIFAKHNINGTRLPLLAANSGFLSKVLAITNPIHRSKLALKAMDVVLFGPPKEQSNFIKDIILSTLLVLALSCLFYAYRQNKQSQKHLKKLMADLESLTRAEEALKELQDCVVNNGEGPYTEHKRHDIPNPDEDLLSEDAAATVSRLKDEVEVLRNDLQRAEHELEDRCWIAPPVLQHWLQLTYEIESGSYELKKKCAEKQLESAKQMCERLKRKRSSFVGAFVSTHGGSITDVDQSIMAARSALLEVTKDLRERTQRWRQMEILCGCSIVNNVGKTKLMGMVRYVGGPSHYSNGLEMTTAKYISDSFSLDDSISIASSRRPIAATVTQAPASSTSSSGEELTHSRYHPEVLATVSSPLSFCSTPPPLNRSRAPGLRFLPKSFSQDAGCTVALPSGGTSTDSGIGVLHNSVSDSQLQAVTSSSQSGFSTLGDLQEQSSESTVLKPGKSTSTGIDFDLSDSRKQKATTTTSNKSSFFNFRKKKDKRDIL